MYKFLKNSFHTNFLLSIGLSFILFLECRNSENSDFDNELLIENEKNSGQELEKYSQTNRSSSYIDEEEEPYNEQEEKERKLKKKDDKKQFDHELTLDKQEEDDDEEWDKQKEYKSEYLQQSSSNNEQNYDSNTTFNTENNHENSFNINNEDHGNLTKDSEIVKSKLDDTDSTFYQNHNGLNNTNSDTNFNINENNYKNKYKLDHSLSNDEKSDNKYIYNHMANEAGKMSFFSRLTKDINPIKHMVNKVTDIVKNGTKAYGDLKKGNFKQAIQDINVKEIEKTIDDPNNKKMFNQGENIFQKVGKVFKDNKIDKKKRKKKLEDAQNTKKDLEMGEIKKEKDSDFSSDDLNKQISIGPLKRISEDDIKRQKDKIDDLDKNGEDIKVHFDKIQETENESDNLNDSNIHPAKSVKLLSKYVLHISKILHMSKSQSMSLKLYEKLINTLEEVKRIFKNISNYMEGDKITNKKIMIYAFSLLDPDKNTDEIKSKDINEYIKNKKDFFRLNTFKISKSKIKTEVLSKEIEDELNILNGQQIDYKANAEILKNLVSEKNPFDERENEIKELTKDMNEIKTQKENTLNLLSQIIRIGLRIKTKLKTFNKFDETIINQTTFTNDKNEIIILQKEEQEALNKITKLIKKKDEELRSIKKSSSKNKIKLNLKEVENIKTSFLKAFKEILNQNISLKKKVNTEINNQKTYLLNYINSNLCVLYIDEFKIEADKVSSNFNYKENKIENSINELKRLKEFTKEKLPSAKNKEDIYNQELNIFYSEALMNIINQIVFYYKNNLESYSSIIESSKNIEESSYKKAAFLNELKQQLKKDINLIKKNINLDIYEKNLKVLLENLESDYEKRINTLRKEVNKTLE